MPDAIGGLGGDAARRTVLREDRMALAGIVREHGTCEATGERLDAENAVAMTVTVSPGVSRLAVVSAAHWDSGNGALSAADPDVDPDVLDGRKLFAREEAGTRPGGSERGLQSPGPRTGGAKPVQRPPRSAEGRAGVSPRVS
jgi:hypothetical protein